MKIKATFIGSNSLGYEHGKDYELKIINVGGISIQRLDGTGRCPYTSLSTFLNNWNNIKVVSYLSKSSPKK
jgi:hypothetical protein